MKCKVCGANIHAKPDITGEGWIVFHECIVRGDTEEEAIVKASTRYVRADVAERYARMREYISRRDAWKCGTKDCICNESGICDCHSYTTYEEAQQAAQREGK